MLKRNTEWARASLRKRGLTSAQIRRIGHLGSLAWFYENNPDLLAELGGEAWKINDEHLVLLWARQCADAVDRGRWFEALVHLHFLSSAEASRAARQSSTENGQKGARMAAERRRERTDRFIALAFEVERDLSKRGQPTRKEIWAETCRRLTEDERIERSAFYKHYPRG